MAYSKNKKKDGIGRERRGRKPKDHDPEVQRIVDEAVEDIADKAHKSYHEQIYKNHMIAAPSVKFDHPDLYKNGKYTAADRIAAVVAWMVTGSMYKAEKYCNVPADTIARWKRESEWWPVLTQQVKKEKNDELEAMMTGILHQSLEGIMERLTEGDTFYDSKDGTTYKLPVKAKDAAVISAVLFDKRQLLRGDVTSRTEKVSTEQRLGKLKDQFEKFSNATEIEGEKVDE